MKKPKSVNVTLDVGDLYALFFGDYTDVEAVLEHVILPKVLDEFHLDNIDELEKFLNEELRGLYEE